MMKKKPTRKYAAGGMAPTQTDKFNAASKAAMQKSNTASKPMGASGPAPTAPTTKQKAQELKAARQGFGEYRKSGALKENVQAQKKDMRAALKSGVVPKEARKSVREQIKNTNVKSVAQGVRSMFQEDRKAIQAERATNKARRQTAKAMGSVANSAMKGMTK
jgi:hypothetical protein